MELTLNISAIVAIIGALTVLTNIIVEVLKRATWEKMPTNLLAIIVAMVLTLVLCVAFTALGLALIPAMLALMNTPAEVLPESTAYLSIYFSGITGLLIYNMGSGILRAVGDSRRPLYFLIVSSVTNVILDLLFVAVLRWGVWSAALTTIISQALSAVLCVIHLAKKGTIYQLKLSALRLDGPLPPLQRDADLPQGRRQTRLPLLRLHGPGAG